MASLRTDSSPVACASKSECSRFESQWLESRAVAYRRPDVFPRRPNCDSPRVAARAAGASKYLHKSVKVRGPRSEAERQLRRFPVDRSGGYRGRQRSKSSGDPPRAECRNSRGCDRWGTRSCLRERAPAPDSCLGEHSRFQLCAQPHARDRLGPLAAEPETQEREFLRAEQPRPRPRRRHRRSRRLRCCASPGSG